MSADPPAPPHIRLWHTAKEYVTHWFVAGVIVTLTGFTPDHWVANVFHAVNLDSLRGVFSEYQFLAVYTGVTFLIVDMVVRNRRRQFEPAAAAPALADASGFVAASPDTSSFAKATEDKPVLEVIEGKPSIAVLPFVNMSSDPEKEYFADGMTEDIITGLSCDSRLFVIARNSTFAYKGQSPDIRTVGKELGVRYVLEGSVRPIGERLRITVQLIETASGTHVWADKIDRPKAELFEIMDEVVDGLVMALCSNLGVAEAKRAARQRPEDLQAWALCVQAEAFFLLHASPESLLPAERLLRRATEIEPGYGVSWAFLAWLASLRRPWGLNPADPARYDAEAITLAGKALSLAPDDPVVLGFCGTAFIWAGLTARGIDCQERSLEINPNSGLFRLYYGAALLCDGRPEAGIAQLEMFFRLSPKDPNAGHAYFFYGWCYLALGSFAQAEQAARETVKILPGFDWGYYVLAMSLAGLGQLAEARQQMRTTHQMSPAWTRQSVEDFWRHVIRKPEDAEKFIALTRQAWQD